MKLIASLTTSILTLFVSTSVHAALPLSPEQIEVKHFIEKMYFYDPATFEYGDFDSQLRPFTRKYLPNKQAKHLPAEHCNLLKTMFTVAMLPSTQSKSGCHFPEKTTHIRFPNISDEDLSPAPRNYSAFDEKFSIAAPVVLGNQAKVAVFTRKARSLYFLTKTDQGWLIRNVMVHSDWPDLDDRTHSCMFEFVLPPSPEEKKEILPHCR